MKTLTPPSGRYKTPDNRRKLVIQAVQKSDEGRFKNDNFETSQIMKYMLVENTRGLRKEYRVRYLLVLPRHLFSLT